MRYIHNTETDPAWNLAAEEWLLRHTDTDIFMLWRNARAVIVGRNQNANAEINTDFVRDNGIKVIRRLTGGGAVFHDLGNVNFSFIQLGRQRLKLDFQRFAEPILDALRNMGVDCSFDGRNDMVINGQKFSGNAQHLEKDRVLHHGTLLFSSHMADLSGALRVNPVKYADKAVKSVHKRVTNISSHLAAPMDVTDFIERLLTHVSHGAAQSDLGLQPHERDGIDALRTAKYDTWQWNFGESPNYAVVQAVRTPGGVIEAHLDTRQGIIQGLRLYGDFFGVRPVAELEAMLHGQPHDRHHLLQTLEAVNMDEFIRGVSAEEFVRCLL